MQGDPLLGLWADLPLDPQAQLATVREFATRVLGTELDASAWLGRTHPNILSGCCVISEACRSREGFRDAVIELARMARG
jgi:hypothetical protein